MTAVLIGLGVVVLVVIIAMRRRRSATDAAAVTRELRERALTVGADELGLTTDPGKPWGVVMETGYPGAVASLVTFIDGTASIYFSSGGGFIGGGQHASVNEAARAFVTRAAGEMTHFEAAPDHPLPAEGITRFYIRTDASLRTASAPEIELGEGRHPLSELFHAGHEVITQLRIKSGG